MDTTKTFAAALGIEPGEVVRPKTVEDVQKAVSDAAETGRAIIPWGGGTAQTYGYLPTRADVLLDMLGMNRVLAHEPGDLTVTVQAGATLDLVQNVLASRNQFLPLDAGHAQTATMGGIIAANAWGPGRTGYGTVRDWLIGLTVVDAQGRLVKGGGKVVKNVTGYDTPKLHIGALGTLGVIVEATFKVAPRPEAVRPVFICIPHHADGKADFVARLLRETTPTYAVAQDGLPHGPVFALLYAGYEAVVEHEAEKAAQIAHDFGADVVPTPPAGVPHPFAVNEAPTYDTPLIAHFAGRPAQAWAQHGRMMYMDLTVRRILTHPATGHTITTLPTDADAESAARKMGQWAQETQTPLAFLHAPLALRRRENAGFPLWSPLPPALPIMQKLKQTLDPKNTLNPGRFVV